MMESQWLAMAKRLLALAQTGQQFTHDDYDKERYQEVASIALTMLAQLGKEPIERIQNLVTSDESGYVTPKVEVRGAVFKEDKILLVQEKEDGLWTLPGGYADVGLSAAQNVEKEVQEEAGLVVKATYLYALRHKAKGNYPADVRDFYKLHFLCEGGLTQAPSPGLETQDARYFSRDEIPPLSLGKVLPEDLCAAWAFSTAHCKKARFD
jgi:ADP-ribose pyrophosphatase YjhB (NUDIX family)